jgi:iron complex outermembrane receptor protein
MKPHQMKFITMASLFLPIVFNSPSVFAAEGTVELEHSVENLEEIIVTSTLHRSRADTALPVNLLAGEELREKLGSTLGETLQSQVGVNLASFGPNVGTPVIRGQGANRVQILQGGIGNIDASAISADHATSLEPALADRIEVLRGPSTLLYGNGAIGGVVNVIDNRIPTRLPDSLTGFVETRNNSASDQQVSVLKLEGATAQVAWHIDGVYRDSNDVEIPGFALDSKFVDISDEEELDALLESRGKIRNSSARANVKTLGASWILNQGYIGFSLNSLNNEYGIPSGSHGYEEEPEVEGDHLEENVRIVMEQDRADFELVLPLTGWFSEIHGRIGSVDYSHAEMESSGEIGTLFKQDGLEGRFVFHLAAQENHEAVVGTQFSHRNFSALGEEAFVPSTDIDSSALFSVYSIDTDKVIYEFGARAERRELAQTRGQCGNTETSWSSSGSAIWRLSDKINLLISAARSQRSASVEELYSNIDTSCATLPLNLLVQHAATQRIEIGNPNANKEESINFEIGLRRHLGNVTGEINIFYNDIVDYIYLSDSDNRQGGVLLSQYLQEDALFKGFEVEMNIPFYRTGDHLSELTVFSDFVDAEFRRIGDVPRIPPFRMGLEWRHSHVHWQTKLRWSRAGDQKDVGFNESESESYNSLSFYADYHVEGNGFEILWFLRGTNLLDVTIRHHSSLLKDFSPAPGRAIELGLRMEF